MDVTTQYLFQSPSPNPVQVGRPDTSTQKEDTSKETQTQETVEVEQTTPELQTQAPDQLNLTSPNQLIDLYV